MAEVSKIIAALVTGAKERLGHEITRQPGKRA